jgi:hypothetical protein
MVLSFSAGRLMCLLNCVCEKLVGPAPSKSVLGSGLPWYKVFPD